MTRKSGFKTWPPLWTATHQSRDDKPIGEVGTLEEAMMSDLIDNKIFVFMLHQGLRYMGVMGFDDRPFCYAIYTVPKIEAGSVHE